MRFGWLCDIHLNFLGIRQRLAFYDELNAAEVDAFVVSGDIAEAPGLNWHLEEMAVAVKVPIYFVLGNHDYYRGSVARTREKATRLSTRIENLHWLPAAGVVPLSKECALVGHGCWGDGRLGDYWQSRVRLNDFMLIKELKGHHGADLLGLLHHLGDEAAAFLRGIMHEALASYEHVFCVTHVPPILEEVWCEEGQADPEFLPFFTCQAAGKVLDSLAESHPANRLTVLSGHTHMAATLPVRPNLELCIGAASYCEPTLQRIFEV